MAELNYYHIDGTFTSENAGFCRWAIGERGGREYFIKEFLSPKFPAENSGLKAETIAKKRAECERFFDQKAKLYREIQQCRTGNIMIIHDFFRSGSKYYAVSEKVNAEKMTVVQVAALPPEKKRTLICSILYSFSELHRRGIVHSDVKPDNILLKKTEKGYYTGKIIDFDAGFFETDVPEEIQGDQVYLAPEMRLRMMEIPVPVTTKADVYALGILFHQYWTGELPTFSGEYNYLFEAVLDGASVSLSGKLPPDLAGQIRAMLQEDQAKRPSAEQVLRALRNEKPSDPEEPVSHVKFNGFSPMTQLG